MPRTNIVDLDAWAEAYESARVLASVTGSVGATHTTTSVSYNSGERVVVELAKATWNRRDESAPFKHAAMEPLR